MPLRREDRLREAIVVLPDEVVERWVDIVERSGRLKTARPEVMEHYRTIVDRYDGTVYRNMIVAVLEGVTPYNRYINHTPPYKWVIHPNWYTTAGFRAKHDGMLGRSNGCITVDPVENNKLITRLEGALIYVTVGDAPIEQYL